VVGDEKMMLLVEEVEVLKRALEEEQQRRARELQELQVWRGGGVAQSNIATAESHARKCF
jgi:hypothetical protein